jgi:type IX secretion system PorP/SprF family membrane protein
MKNLIIPFVLFAVVLITKVQAQQMPFSSQYYSNQFITNPALTGNKGSMNAFLTHRTQWVGISGAPQTTYFTLDGEMKKDGVGVGIVLYSDVTDILSRTGGNFNYAYKLKINESNLLTFGLALGIVNNKVDFTKTVVLDKTDPFLNTQQISRTVGNADFGLAYNWNKLEVGFSMPQLVGNSFNFSNDLGTTGSYTLARHYYGSVKYLFDVNVSRGITAYPLLMVRSVSGSPFQYDINGVIDWKKYGWFGITYHSNYAIAFSLGARYKKFSVGYAYDLGISKIKRYTGTTSEFLLSYNLGESGNNSDEIDKLKLKVSDLSTKDSLNQIKINDLIKKDTLNDSLVQQLKIMADSNAVIIERLNERLNKVDGGGAKSAEELKKQALEKAKIESELAKMKEKEDSTNMALKMAEKSIPMKTGQTKEFSSQGSDAKAGYYVIIGAFTNESNAKVFTKDAKRRGYKSAEIIKNKKNEIYEIVVFKTQKRQPAIDKLEGIKSDYPDVWVLTLE